jgi:small membrane protein
MTSIQVLLITLSLMAAIVGSLAFRSRLGNRLLAALFFATATGFILFPDGTTAIAHFLGVGRGTDLLLYIALFAGIHAFFLLYLRMRRLERKLTEQIRANAIRDAHRLGTG